MFKMQLNIDFTKYEIFYSSVEDAREDPMRVLEMAGIWNVTVMWLYNIHNSATLPTAATPCQHCMSSVTTHVSDSGDGDQQQPKPSLHTMDSLCKHCQKCVHLRDCQMLQNGEHYASIRDLIWLNRIEISGIWRSFRNLQYHMEILEHKVDEGFASLQEDVADLKAIILGVFPICQCRLQPTNFTVEDWNHGQDVFETLFGIKTRRMAQSTVRMSTKKPFYPLPWWLAAT